MKHFILREQFPGMEVLMLPIVYKVSDFLNLYAGAVCGTSQHQPHCSEAARHPQAWDESVFCQVQWSHICEAWEAGHHDTSCVSS